MVGEEEMGKLNARLHGVVVVVNRSLSVSLCLSSDTTPSFLPPVYLLLPWEENVDLELKWLGTKNKESERKLSFLFPWIIIGGLEERFSPSRRNIFSLLLFYTLCRSTLRATESILGSFESVRFQSHRSWGLIFVIAIIGAFVVGFHACGIIYLRKLSDL